MIYSCHIGLRRREMRTTKIRVLLIFLTLLLLFAGCRQPLVQDPDFSTDFDLDPPASSSLNGVAATQNTTPSWSYDSGGNGSYLFRFRLNGGEWQTVTHTPPGPFTYTPPSPLVEGVHVFEVQERDDRGNWSQSASFRTVVDVTPPEPPIVSTNGANPTTDTQPTWTWSSNTGNGLFRYDSTNAGGSGVSGETSATSYTPSAPLADGTYTLSVEERDEAGNWSLAGSHSITVDTNNQPPTANVVAPGSADVGAAFTLDGSGSSDPESDPLSYSWSVTSAPAGATWSFGTPSGATTSFTANQGGSYTVALGVTANGGSDTATASFFVNDINNGLTAHYPLNSGVVVDQGPNGWDGVVNGATATANRKGTAGMALSFDGVDDIVDISGGPFTTTNRTTVSFWVNVPVSRPLRYFIRTGGGGIGIFSSGTSAGLAISLPSTSSAAGAVTLGAWHHVVGTYDGTTIRVYIDNVLAGTKNHPGLMEGSGSATGPLVLGFFNSSYWQGSIDDLRLYDRVLTTAEIHSLYNE
jgi:hypothetical protein